MTNSAPTETIFAKTSRTEPGQSEPGRTRRHRENTSDNNVEGVVRYFLGKTGSSGGTPALDKEVNTEGEALVEALRQGVTFYEVQEFRVVADLAGRRPQLTKEPVPRTN